MPSNDPRRLVSHQYRDSSNLDARIALHQRFSVTTQSFRGWVFGRLELTPGLRILEVGCGSGDLWLENITRIGSLDLTLSDLSPGMVSEARDRLNPFIPTTQFLVADIQALPFDDRRFDVVTANHMLYHVPDRQTAIAEVWRVLKPGGRFLAVTNGENHFLELREMVARFAPGFEALLTDRAFSLQNGGEQLAEVFPQPTTSIFEDRLVITESQPVVDYLKSIASFDGDAQQILQQIEESVAEEIAQDGAFHITKEVGLFEAVRSDASKAHLALLDSR